MAHGELKASDTIRHEPRQAERGRKAARVQGLKEEQTAMQAENGLVIRQSDDSPFGEQVR